jgi:hypothetical protein
MPITYPLAFPTTFGVSGFSIGIDNAISSTVSPFTFEEQVQEHQGATWDISFNIELLNRAQAEEYNSFIFKLNGRLGTFTMFVPGSELPRGVVTGTPTVNGASQTGNDLNINNLPLSTSNVFRAGDYIQIETGLDARLYKILEDVNSDGAGEATLLIAPKIIIAHPDAEPIVYNSASGLFRSKTNFSPINISPPNQHTISFSARGVVSG